MPYLAANFLMASRSSSSTTRPRICSRSLYFFCSSTRSGISARHGPHHVAQKFTSTTFPLEPARVTGLPSRPARWKSGAGSGLRTKRIVGRCSDSCAETKKGSRHRKRRLTKYRRDTEQWNVSFMVSVHSKAQWRRDAKWSMGAVNEHGAPYTPRRRSGVDLRVERG